MEKKMRTVLDRTTVVDFSKSILALGVTKIVRRIGYTILDRKATNKR